MCFTENVACECDGSTYQNICFLQDGSKPLVADTINSLPAQVIPRNKRRLSLAELEAWKVFMRAAARATLALDREAEAAGGLPLSEHFLLIAVAEGPESGVRPTELAERTFLTKSGLTRALDRLETQGLVDRRSCPSDGRGQVIVLTAKGSRVLRRAAPGHFRAVAKHFADLLRPREIEILTEALRRIAAGPAPD